MFNRFSRLPALMAAAFWLFALPAWAADQQVAVPPLTARVTDLTDTLNAGQKASLEDKLARFEKEKGSQLAVLLAPTSGTETIEQYSIRVADTWKIGRKPHDDGVILLVAKNDRKMRLEVGYGLEGALPDAVCKRIIAEDMAPRFKSGDWVGGLNAGVDRVLAAVSGESLPPPAARPDQPAGQVLSPDAALLGMLLVLVAVASLNFLLARLGSLFTSLGMGGFVGYLTLLGTGSTVVGWLAAVVVFVVVLAYGHRSGQARPIDWNALAATRSGRGRSSGYGGDRDFGGGGDSGFSGGGGDFGGGGASGSW